MNVVHCSTEDMQNPHASYDIAQQSRIKRLAKLEKRRLRIKKKNPTDCRADIGREGKTRKTLRGKSPRPRARNLSVADQRW